MTTDEAIEIVARQVAADGVREQLYNGCSEFPELADGHWDRIEDLLAVLCPVPPGEAVAEAFALLEHRDPPAEGDS